MHYVTHNHILPLYYTNAATIRKHAAYHLAQLFVSVLSLKYTYGAGCVIIIGCKLYVCHYCGISFWCAFRKAIEVEAPGKILSVYIVYIVY